MNSTNGQEAPLPDEADATASKLVTEIIDEAQSRILLVLDDLKFSRSELDSQIKAAERFLKAIDSPAERSKTSPTPTKTRVLVSEEKATELWDLITERFTTDVDFTRSDIINFTNWPPSTLSFALTKLRDTNRIRLTGKSGVANTYRLVEPIATP